MPGANRKTACQANSPTELIPKMLQSGHTIENPKKGSAQLSTRIMQ